jgi:hypothetical protein
MNPANALSYAEAEGAEPIPEFCETGCGNYVTAPGPCDDCATALEHFDINTADPRR